MRISQLRPALVLATWTFLVWTTRLRNIWTDDALSTGDQVVRTALALSFTAFAIVVTVSWLAARRSGTLARSAAPWVRAFALWTAAVWMVRVVQIALADHSAAFVVVHAVLAVVSVALAVWAYRAIADDVTERDPVPA